MKRLWILCSFAVLVALVAGACTSNSQVTTTDPTPEPAASSTDDGSSTETTTDTAPASDPEPTATPVPAPADDPEPSEEPEPTATPEPVEEPEPEPDSDDRAAPPEAIASIFFDDDFCSVNQTLSDNDPFEQQDFAPFSEEFFDVLNQVYDRLADIAPGEIAADVEIVRNEIAAFQEIAERYDYNFFNEEFGAEIEALGEGAIDAAGQRIEDWVDANCDIQDDEPDDVDTVPVVPGLDDEALEALENLDPEAAALFNELLLSGLNLDPETQQCLLEQLPDLAEAAEEPDFLTREICGTTFLQIFAGLDS